MATGEIRIVGYYVDKDGNGLGCGGDIIIYHNIFHDFLQ